MSKRGPANRIRANRIRANGILGYPQDARLLIVNADDFGMCHTQNVGTFRAMREGLVRSCSLMAPAPWGLHGTQLLRENPDVPFGVHLTLVSEFRTYRWGPLLPQRGGRFAGGRVRVLPSRRPDSGAGPQPPLA